MPPSAHTAFWGSPDSWHLFSCVPWAAALLRCPLPHSTQWQGMTSLPAVQPAPQGLVTSMSAKSIKSQSEHSVLKSEGMGWKALEEKLFSTCWAEEARGLQSPCLFHHSSSNLAQPLCTSLQLSLSGSCCKIWLLREERDWQEATAESPADLRAL